MGWNGSLISPNHGFESTGVGLSEIIQLRALERFSGCIEIEHGHRIGVVFLRDGAIVHAEQGHLTGEPAFYEIASWPAGRFTFQEDVETPRATIERSLQFLRLEAHRVVDERRAKAGAAAGRTTLPAAPTPVPAARTPVPAARTPVPAARTPVPAAQATVSAAQPPVPLGRLQVPGPPAVPVEAAAQRPGSSAATLVERLRAVPGVAAVALLGKDGGRASGGGDGAEVLGDEALQLAGAGVRLCQRLQAGELRTVLVQGTAGQLLVVALKHHYLAVLAHPDVQVGAIDAEVRRVLSALR